MISASSRFLQAQCRRPLLALAAAVAGAILGLAAPAAFANSGAQDAARIQMLSQTAQSLLEIQNPLFKSSGLDKADLHKVQALDYSNSDYNKNLRAQQMQAEAIYLYALKLSSNPGSTQFERWETDQWTMIALHCGKEADIGTPQWAKNVGFLTSGSFSSPSKSPCASLAKSLPYPQARCRKPTIMDKPFSMPWPGMMPDYLFVTKGLAMPPSQSTHMGSMRCILGGDSYQNEQLFAGRLTIEHSGSVSRMPVQTGRGPVMVDAVNVTVTTPGYKGQPIPILMMSNPAR